MFDVLKKKRLKTILILLFLVLFSFVLVSSIFEIFEDKTPNTIIGVSDNKEDEDLNDNNEQEYVLPSGTTIVSKPSIKMASIDLFKASYISETGEVTVESLDGSRLVAPGVMNEYDLYIENNGNVPLSYELKTTTDMIVEVGDQTYKVPVEARFYTSEGKYVIGSENNWSHISQLNNIVDKGGLSVNRRQKYTLEWQWPFEGNDEFDTMLGNLAVDEEVKVSVQFFVNAWEDMNASGGSYKTGDNNDIAMYMTIGIVSLFTVIILAFRNRSEENEI